MGYVTESYVSQALASNRYVLFYRIKEHSYKLDFVPQKEYAVISIELTRGQRFTLKILAYLFKNIN